MTRMNQLLFIFEIKVLDNVSLPDLLISHRDTNVLNNKRSICRKFALILELKLRSWLTNS
ncbi:20559_t:CDS:2 [Cetraspora pellucida]|uniref:20559_t:CDS:1 n=1 Tax=Cetraspora pellucida TaxID=1433469 RepID=A0A9N8ZVK1_9GLOM|nr:20559_t:CDS:2 [Cetraspora pellucida]